MIVERIKSYVEQLPEVTSKVAEIRMSMAGDCARKVTMDFVHGVPAIDFQNYMRMESGHALHEMFHGLMRSAFGEDYAEEIECKLVASDYEIIGHCDGVVRSLDCVVEFKSVSDSTFMMIKKMGKPLDQHIAQANLYAFGLNRPNILIVYFNKDNGIFEEFFFERDENLRDEVFKKVQRIMASVRERKTLPREYNDATESPCWYCPHVDKCYEGYKESVESLASKDIEDTEFQSIALMAASHRKSRLESEKREAATKAAVGDAMLNKFKVNQTRVGDFRFIVKVGKNNNMIVDIKEAK